MTIESGIIRAMRDFNYQGVRILLFKTDAVRQPNGQLSYQPIAFASKFEWTPLDPEVVQPLESTLVINNTEAQRLMDDLWNAGLRPTEGSGSAGSLAATQAHLKDMQSLTFRLLQAVEKPMIVTQPPPSFQ